MHMNCHQRTLGILSHGSCMINHTANLYCQIFLGPIARFYITDYFFSHLCYGSPAAAVTA